MQTLLFCIIHYYTALPLTGTLKIPRISVVHYTLDPQLRLVLTRPEGYNTGRFILRYDCRFRGTPIELEYRSVEISGSSDAIVRRSRSCFVVGEISRVTVWFVSGRHISATPAVVNVNCEEGEMEYVMWLHILELSKNKIRQASITCITRNEF